MITPLNPPYRTKGIPPEEEIEFKVRLEQGEAEAFFKLLLLAKSKSMKKTKHSKSHKYFNKEEN